MSDISLYPPKKGDTSLESDEVAKTNNLAWEEISKNPYAEEEYREDYLSAHLLYEVLNASEFPEKDIQFIVDFMLEQLGEGTPKQVPLDLVIEFIKMLDDPTDKTEVKEDILDMKEEKE